MSHIAPCPHCERPVQLASLALGGMRVRCPLCCDEFTIDQVAGIAVAAPPLAEPIVDAPRTSPTAAPEPIESLAAGEPSAGFEPVSLEPGALDTTGSAAEGTPIESSDVVGDSIEMPHNLDAPEMLAGVAPDVEVDWQQDQPPTFTFDGAASDEAARYASSPASGATTYRPRRKQQQSPVGMILGIILGGVVGLTAGYVVLVLIGWAIGRDTDSLGVWKSIRGLLGGGTTELSQRIESFDAPLTSQPPRPFDAATSGR